MSRWHVHRIPAVGWRIDEVPIDCAASGFATLERAEAEVRAHQEAELHLAKQALEIAQRGVARKRAALKAPVDVRRRERL